MDSFLILGHGTEELIEFPDRPELPDGVILVILQECGLVTDTDTVCPITEAFTDQANADIFRDPYTYKTQIEALLGGKQIHIFKSGNKYPQLFIQFFLDWKKEDHISIFKSGTYKFPINKQSMTIGEGATFCNRLFKTIGPYTGFNHQIPADYKPKDMFEGSVYPRTEYVNQMISETHKSAVIKGRLTVPLENIFDNVGPGIYYYVVCRSPKDIRTPKDLVDFDIVDNMNGRYTPYFEEDWLTKIDEILPLIDANLATIPRHYWTYDSLSATRKNYNRIRKIPAIRHNSSEQQRNIMATLNQKAQSLLRIATEHSQLVRRFTQRQHRTRKSSNKPQ